MQAMRTLPANIHQMEHGGRKPPPGLLLAPALVALPLIRWPLGYETVQPIKTLLLRLMVAFLAFLLSRFYPQAQMGWEWLTAYLALSYVVACVMFAQRNIGQKRGEEVHTTEAGWSHLAWRTNLPVWLCEQVLVPLAVAAAGYVVAQSLSWELGWWLVATGASLFVLARWESAKRWQLTRTTVDKMLQAQLLGQRVEQHEARAYNPLAGSPDRKAQGRSATVDEPDVAELGGARPKAKAASYRPAPPPDAASFGDAGGTNPDFMTWIRKRRK
jgi:hypothetical protein